MKNCLTIAGSDCSGGAGIQADLKTFSSLGTFGASVIVSVVAENTQRVISVHNMDITAVENQIDAVFSDLEISAVKLGMLPTVEIIKAVAKKLEEYKPKYIVCDPVMVATSGDSLSSESTCEALKKYIFPLADIITPNIPETQELSGIEVKDINDFDNAAEIIMKTGVKSLLIKGGHFKNEEIDDCIDILYQKNCDSISFCNERVSTQNTHGTGCTLSSAICAYLAKGETIETAVEKAKNYITTAISYADDLNVGKGHGPVNHFWEFYKMKGILK